MKRRLLAVLLVAACTTDLTPPPEPPEKPGIIAATVTAPVRAAWDPTSFHPVGGEIAITLTNTRATAIPIGDVRVLFLATRDGVPMGCEREPRVPAHEAHVIGAHQRLAFARSIDCSMPFPGRYVVRVLGSWSSTAAPLREIGSFALEVEATTGREPRAIRPGLLGALAGPQLAHPTSSYAVAVAVLNASAVVQPLGPARILVRSHPVEHDVWCQGRPTDVVLPESLGPGKMHVMRAELGCDLEKPGFYAVQAELALAGGTSVVIGEMRVRITGDPMELTPPLPPLP